MSYPQVEFVTAMDLITGATIMVGLRTVGPPAAKVLSEVVGQMLGQPAIAISDGLAHPIREFFKKRQERAERIVLDAARIVSGHKKQLQAVPGRILLPILEHGSVEDDPGLRQVWSRLLASAAMPNPDVPVLTAYAKILAELSPLEVKILRYIIEQCQERITLPDERPYNAHVFRQVAISRRFRIRPALCMAIRDNLNRLFLIQCMLLPPGDPSLASWPHTVTNLGYEFYAACTGEDGYPERI